MSLVFGSSFGPYRIMEPLGKGGMASVYKAYEAALDRYVALKVLPGEYLHDQDFSERFNREARLIARLEHPNIIPIYNFGIDEPTRTPWISLRLVPGGSLAATMKQGRLPHARVLEILEGAAAALDYAHFRGVIHRDVKPQNILLDEAGRVYLADFGIARMLEGSAALTQAGMITGTPQYMAPEQATGQTLDNRADVYALGVVAYEMLTGHVPFSADTPLAVLMKHVQEPLPVPSPHDVPDGMMHALLKSLAKTPADRWPTAVAFVEAMRAGLGTGSTASEAPTAGLRTTERNVQPVTERPAMPSTVPPRPPTHRGPMLPPPPPPPPRPPTHHAPAAPATKSRLWLFVGIGVGAVAMGVGLLGLLIIIGLANQPDPSASPSPAAAPPTIVAGATTDEPEPAPAPVGTPAPSAVEDVQPTPAPRIVVTPAPIPEPEERVYTPRRNPDQEPAGDVDDTEPQPAQRETTAVLRIDVDAQQGASSSTNDVLFLQVMVDGKPVRSMTLVFSGKDPVQRSRKRETFDVPGVPVGSRRVSLVASPDRGMGRDVAQDTAELDIEEGVNRAYAQVRFMGPGSREVRIR